ncbi:Zn-ribbon containing protein [Halobacterium sp. NMX12-1]|uniref:Zn-ribbon containing protein n=1 Tax=Halobacterium sp. NMX12-1 TaxID=3166650 RepID=A0AAU8CF12_9EURY
MPHQCTNCGHVFADGSKEMLSGCPDCGGNKFQYHPGDVAESEPADPPADADADAPEPPEPEGGSVAGAVGRAANKVRDAVTSDPDPAARTSAEDTDATDAATADDATTTDGADTASTANAADASDAADTADAADAATADATTADGTPDAEADPSAPETGGEAVEESGDEPAEAIDASTETDVEDAAQADARSSVVDTDSLPDAPAEGRVVKEPDDSEDRPDLDELRQELNDQFESIRIVAPGQYELNLMELYDRQEYIIALQEDGQYVIEVPDAWETDE